MRKPIQEETTCPRRPSQSWDSKWGSLSPLLACAPTLGCSTICKSECTAGPQNISNKGMFVASEIPQLWSLSTTDQPSPGTAWNLQSKCQRSLIHMLFLGSTTRNRVDLAKDLCGQDQPETPQSQDASQRQLHNLWVAAQNDSVEPSEQKAGKLYH